MLRAFHVETNVDQGGVWFWFVAERFFFFFGVSSCKIQELVEEGIIHPLLPSNLWTPSSVRIRFCPHFLSAYLLTATAQHITSPDHYYLSCVGKHPSQYKWITASEIKKVSSACDHLMSLGNGKETQMLGKWERGRCSMCLFSLKSV